MPPAPLGTRLCRMPAPCLTGRSFLQSPGTTARSPASAHSPQKMRLFPLRQAAAQSMCAARRRPSLPEQTSLPHATAKRRLPPRFPIGEYTGVHSAPTFPRRPFPAPFHFRAFRAALPRASPRRPPRFTPLCFALLQQPPNLRPRDSFPVFTPRVAPSLFLLAPSFTRPAKQAASRLSDSASGFPAARRRPSSGVST